MTTELAIRILIGDVLGTSEQTHEAIKMAVSALSHPDVTDINAGDTIYRQAALDAVEESRRLNHHVDAKAASCHEYEHRHFLKILSELPPAQPEQQWILCSERLPQEDVEVLISYRYKEGEGDTSHIDIDITTYGQMYFGGNKVGNYKHWRAPFEYFESNYEVVAWMPLPEPYKEEKNGQ